MPNRNRERRGAPGSPPLSPVPARRLPPLRTVGEWRRAAAARLREADIASPAREADWIASHVLGIPPGELVLSRDRPLAPGEKRRLSRFLHKRIRRFPLQYLLGDVDFFGLSLRVKPAVLIPRPETEGLVEHVLRFLDEREPATVLDVGTGSGAIALALAAQRPRLRVWATDSSEAALRVARANAKRLGLGDRVVFRAGDLTEPFAGEEPPHPLRVVVSNPPYVAVEDRDRLATEIVEHEPHGALFAGETGLSVIERLVPRAARLLPAGGLLALEIGETQGAAVTALCDEDAGTWRPVRIERDLAGKNRYALVLRDG